MMPNPDLSTEIEENAEGPKRATGDNGTVEQHSLQDQIAADKYLKGSASMRSGGGFTLRKIVPGSALG